MPIDWETSYALDRWLAAFINVYCGIAPEQTLMEWYEDEMASNDKDRRGAGRSPARTKRSTKR